MNPRGKIVAIQGAAVTALVVVVYMTLLRPEGPSTISGIEAPDRGATPRVEAEERPGQRQPKAIEKRRRRGASSPGAAAAAGLPGEGVVAATDEVPPGGAVAAPQTAGEVPPGGAVARPQTPPGDQYGDTVKALLDRVGAARLPGQ